MVELPSSYKSKVFEHFVFYYHISARNVLAATAKKKLHDAFVWKHAGTSLTHRERLTSHNKPARLRHTHRLPTRPHKATFLKGGDSASNSGAAKETW